MSNCFPVRDVVSESFPLKEVVHTGLTKLLTWSENPSMVLVPGVAISSPVLLGLTLRCDVGDEVLLGEQLRQKPARGWGWIWWITRGQWHHRRCFASTPVPVVTFCKKLETQEGLWQQVVRAKYFKNKTINTTKTRVTDSPCWKSIMKVRELYLIGRKISLQKKW